MQIVIYYFLKKHLILQSYNQNVGTKWQWSQARFFHIRILRLKQFFRNQCERI